MKYMLLVYDDPAQWPETTEEEMKDLYDEYAAVTKDPATVHSAQLAPVTTAKTVRVNGDGVLATDGPFAETKEQLGGYYLVDVGSLDEALEWAAKIPGARHGAIEVRPVMVFEEDM